MCAEEEVVEAKVFRHQPLPNGVEPRVRQPVIKKAPDKAVEGVPTWLKLADELKGRRFDKVTVLSEFSPAQAIAGFIYSKLGIITPNAALILRDDIRMSDELRSNSMPLFNEAYLFPPLLSKLIIENQGINWLERRNLKKLVSHAEHYRDPLFARQWWKAVDKMNDGPNVFHRSLFSFLRYQILSKDSPREAYFTCQRVLANLINRETMDYSNLAPTEIEIPALKSHSNEPDKIEMARFKFDRSRALLLVKSSPGVTLAVGGSPNSGKSTFSASLFVEMSRLVASCVEDGILEKGALSVGFCDLDLASPTSCFIARREEIIRGEKRKWTADLVDEAIIHLRKVQSENQIVVADLPGGSPDEITQRLAREATFSVLIDRQPERAGLWREFLLGADLPIYLIGVHTRFGESDRESGTREYESKEFGDKWNFLRGRVVDLARELKEDDPFIHLAAHVLLFDFLPGSILRPMQYRPNLIPVTARKL